MTVRLEMKLGLVAETDRLAESPDTVVAVQPNLGSTARTKGSLFVLATGPQGRKYREYTRLVAEKIRDDYYYDESAGIAVCLQKAIRSVNQRLQQAPERVTGESAEPGPIGLAIVVVRGQELYVVTVGPAEAYLLRQARLLTLPDANPSPGLPDADATDPPVWHGEIVAGDYLLLLSPTVSQGVGLATIQDSVVQLHPQAAVEQIHRSLASGGASSGDGIVAIEAVEAAPTSRLQPLRPVWAGDARPGAIDRLSAPLASSIGGGVAVVASSARQIQRHAGDVARGAVNGLFDRMPRRSLLPGRVLPPWAQRERQRRVASAIVGMLLVLLLVGTVVAVLANGRQDQGIDQAQQGQSAYNQIQANLDKVFGHGRDLLTTDPDQAGELLKQSYSLLTVAKQKGYTDEELADSKSRVVAGLNRYYHAIVVDPRIILSFEQDELTALVLGPDGCAYVLDKSTDTVYRVDLAAKTRMPVLFKGKQVSGATVGSPILLATGGQDVLVLDDKNVLWKWRPAIGDTTGRGVPIKVRIDDAVNWGGEIRGIGTYVTNPNLGLYSIYVVDPTSQQILRYIAARDGSGYRGAAENYLAVPRDISSVSDLFIDGSLYLSQKGSVIRFDSGIENKRWKAETPPDTILRPQAPAYTRIAADSLVQDEGRMYLYDFISHRVVAVRKDNGSYVEQYLVPSTSSQMMSLAGLFVVPGTNGGSVMLYWIDAGNLLAAPLASSATQPGVSPSPSPSSSPSPSASRSP
jgi:hypothetical protein